MTLWLTISPNIFWTLGESIQRRVATVNWDKVDPILETNHWCLPLHWVYENLFEKKDILK